MTRSTGIPSKELIRQFMAWWREEQRKEIEQAVEKVKRGSQVPREQWFRTLWHRSAEQRRRQAGQQARWCREDDGGDS
jgi:hypothetical protein